MIKLDLKEISLGRVCGLHRTLLERAIKLGLRQVGNAVTRRDIPVSKGFRVCTEEVRVILKVDDYESVH
jgi:hypothetical protein